MNVSTATRTGIRPVSKKASGVTTRSGRIPEASSATGSSRRQAAPRRDVPKAIALGACAALFIACVVVAYTRREVLGRLWGKMTGDAPAVVKKQKLPEEAAKVVAAFDKADALYESSQAKVKSDKLEDLQEASKLMGQARDGWAEAREWGKSYEGFEDKRAHAEKMLKQTDKEFRTLNEKVQQLEMESLRKAHQERKARKDGDDTGKTPASAAAANGMETLDEAAYEKMKDDDPSEYERFAKLIKEGKAQLKKKGAEQPAPETPAKTEEKKAEPEAPAPEAKKAEPPPAAPAAPVE
jgi:hypothetical protein